MLPGKCPHHDRHPMHVVTSVRPTCGCAAVEAAQALAQRVGEVEGQHPRVCICSHWGGELYGRLLQCLIHGDVACRSHTARLSNTCGCTGARECRLWEQGLLTVAFPRMVGQQVRAVPCLQRRMCNQVPARCGHPSPQGWSSPELPTSGLLRSSQINKQASPNRSADRCMHVHFDTGGRGHVYQPAQALLEVISEVPGRIQFPPGDSTPGTGGVSSDAPVMLRAAALITTHRVG